MVVKWLFTLTWSVLYKCTGMKCWNYPVGHVLSSSAELWDLVWQERQCLLMLCTKLRLLKATCGIELQSLLQQRLFSFLNCEQCVETCLSRGQAAHHERTEDGRHRGVEKERKNYWIRNVYRINRKCCQVGAQMYRDITRWRKCHWKWEIVNAAETKCAHLVARCYKVAKRKSAHAKIEISLLPELNVSSCSPEAFTPITHPRIK